MPANVARIGHVGTAEHNAFNGSPLAVLNVARDSMAKVGFSPATRVFEAAGAGACLITDAWEGLELFLANPARRCWSPATARMSPSTWPACRSERARADRRGRPPPGPGRAHLRAARRRGRPSAAPRSSS
jgi:hypothetical protein